MKSQRLNYQNQLNKFFNQFQKEYSIKFEGLLTKLSNSLSLDEVQQSLALNKLVPGIESQIRSIVTEFAQNNLGELIEVAFNTVFEDLDKRVEGIDWSQISVGDIEQSIIDNFVDRMTSQQIKALTETIEYCNRDHRLTFTPKEELSKIIQMGSGLNSVLLRASINTFASMVDTSSTVYQAKVQTAKVISTRTGYRAKVLSTDEILHNYRSAEQTAVQEGLNQGIFHGMVKKWSTAGDNRVCNICKELDGKVVDFNEPFITDSGLEIDDTTGAHSLCRCGIEYIEKELYDLGIY